MSFGVQRFVDDEVVVPVNLVVDALPLLVLDDLLFLRDHRFGDCVDEEAELVRLRPQRLLQAVDRHYLEVVGAIAVGRAIGRASDPRHQAVEAARAEVLRVQEEQVLEDMREPRPPWHLTRRPDVERHRDGGGRVRAVDVNRISPREAPARHRGRWRARSARSRSSRRRSPRGPRHPAVASAAAITIVTRRLELMAFSLRGVTLHRDQRRDSRWTMKILSSTSSLSRIAPRCSPPSRAAGGGGSARGPARAPSCARAGGGRNL